MKTISNKTARFMARGPVSEVERKAVEQSVSWLVDVIFACHYMANNAPNPADKDMMERIAKALQDRHDALSMGLSRNN